MVQLKFSKSNDYTLCFLDIFDFGDYSLKYLLLNIPFCIELSGDCSFIKPLYICEDDAFWQSLYFSVNRNSNNHSNEILENLLEPKECILNSQILN